MKVRLLHMVFLGAAIFAQTAQAADNEAGPIAQKLLASFERWLAPHLSNGFAMEEPVTGEGSPVDTSASGIAPTSDPAKPSAALRDEGTQLGYYGVHFAVAVLSEDGRHLVLRPFNKGFRSGERFKLRVVSSFDGYVQAENINPKWERKPILPSVQGRRIFLQAGHEMLIPGGKNEYFEFTGSIGEERLVVTVRDVRASEKNMSLSRVYRQDRNYGSNFIQQAAFDTYPAIAGTVKLQHQ